MSIISPSGVDTQPRLQNLNQPVKDQDYDLMECDAVRCGRNLLFQFSKKKKKIYIYITNCMRYADLKALVIKILELDYVTVYRLVTKVSTH
jgi:hypothetical protein